jgi:hypothetical protein
LAYHLYRGTLNKIHPDATEPGGEYAPTSKLVVVIPVHIVLAFIRRVLRRPQQRKNNRNHDGFATNRSGLDGCTSTASDPKSDEGTRRAG